MKLDYVFDNADGVFLDFKQAAQKKPPHNGGGLLSI
jgi:hypothetical protein